MEVDIVFLCLLHYNNDSCDVVHSHVHNFFVLALIKEFAVLVNYEFMIRIYARCSCAN